MTEKEIRIWMAQENAEDRWQVSVDGKPLPDSRRLSEALWVVLPTPESVIEILHVSQWEAKDPAWVNLDPQSQLSEKKRAKLRKHKGHWKRNGWKGNWQIAIILGLVLFFILIKNRNDTAVDEEISPMARADPMEVIFERIEQQRRMRGPVPQINEGGKPRLDGQIVVARSERLLFVANLSDVEWESCEVILNGDNGYRYRWDRPIASGETLHQPLRAFRKANEPFNMEEIELEEVRVRVPGFEVWQDDF